MVKPGPVRLKRNFYHSFRHAKFRPDPRFLSRFRDENVTNNLPVLCAGPLRGAKNPKHLPICCAGPLRGAKHPKNEMFGIQNHVFGQKIECFGPKIEFSAQQ